MPFVDVVNLEGKTVGQVELADAVFAAKVKPHLLHETVRWQLAGERAGTHSTKRRGEVSGSGKKLWRQKGTGRARVGSIRSPIWRKGGTVHGPKPRDYSYRIPRKVLLGALRSALSAKLAEQKLTVVDAWTLESHKTKAFRQVVDKVGEQARSFLLVEGGSNRNLELASRNIAGAKLVKPGELRPYDLLRHERILLSKETALRLSNSLTPRKRGELVMRAAAAPVVTIAPAPAAPAVPEKAEKKVKKEKRTAAKAAKPKAKRGAKE
jgi:large subunit ribosomal protein L4